MIIAQGLHKSFRSVTALSDVSFTAPDGSITGIVGPNGAGKTTAIRILCTVLRPDEGSVTIDGHDTRTDRVAAQRCLGVLPDTRGLYMRLTAREQIRYYGRLHGMGAKDLEHRIDVLSESLGMADIIDRRAKGFSRGQTLKLGLARALIHDPQNLLFDEPTNGLDIASSRAVRALLRDLKARGRAILFCSHILQEVAALCDRLLVLGHGRVVAEGSVEELCAATGKSDLEEALLVLTRAQREAA